jgi:hypothetical protein
MKAYMGSGGVIISNDLIDDHHYRAPAQCPVTALDRGA